MFSDALCYRSGASLISEIFIHYEAHPYVLETDSSLDLAELNLQPASIIIINRSVTLLSCADSQLVGADSKQVRVCSKKGAECLQSSS